MLKVDLSVRPYDAEQTLLASEKHFKHLKFKS